MCLNLPLDLIPNLLLLNLPEPNLLLTHIPPIQILLILLLVSRFLIIRMLAAGQIVPKGHRMFWSRILAEEDLGFHLLDAFGEIEVFGVRWKLGFGG